MPRIIDLADILTALADADVFAVSDIDANQDKKITASNLSSYILKGKNIGGSNDTDITVNNATQTLKNKTLLSPKINSSATTPVTSEDLTKLHSVTVTATEINYLSGASGNIQIQLANKADASALYSRPYFFHYVAQPTSGNIQITESTIRNALNIASNRRISSRLMIQVLNATVAPYTIVSTSNTVIYAAPGAILDYVNISSLTNGQIYVICIICYDVATGGEI